MAPDDAEQTLADGDRTLGDGDRTLSDGDQTSAESDQTSADGDQLASDRDQDASDRDLAAGADSEAHESSREIREHTTHQRQETARARLLAAEERDAVASARDVAAQARDRAADVRMLAIARHDSAQEQSADVSTGIAGDPVKRAADQRRRAARERVRAAEQRALAAQDREAAARDREESARERLRALVDREALARQVALSETDPMTGARTRAAGLTDLDHEIDRCRRTSARLVVAYVDVVGLKALNDSAGHGAGDELLQRVVRVIGAHVRSYDLLIRLGGDEFLVAMSAITPDEARGRFSAITAALGAAPAPAEISTGFAELEPGETAADLIARADGELTKSRRTNQNSRSVAAER